ncbi:hypothetical protein FHS85_001171 [Rhodoligotrophos appendicifer]
MGKTIVGTFETREQAELAVEHLVQELGLDRSDVFVAAAEAENTAGEEFDIVEAERGGPDPAKSEATALNGLSKSPPTFRMQAPPAGWRRPCGHWEPNRFRAIEAAQPSLSGSVACSPAARWRVRARR